MNEKFVSNEFSKWIDQDFSFGGQIKFDNKNKEVKKKVDIYLDGNMSLEPRLQEYIKKKINYRKAGFKPLVPLEKTYQITETDLNAIKQYKRGKNDIYAKGNYNIGLNNLRDKKTPFLSEVLKNDKRVPKLDNSINKFKHVKNIQTMGMFGENLPIINDVQNIMGARDFMEKDSRYLDREDNDRLKKEYNHFLNYKYKNNSNFNQII